MSILMSSWSRVETHKRTISFETDYNWNSSESAEEDSGFVTHDLLSSTNVFSEADGKSISASSLSDLAISTNSSNGFINSDNQQYVKKNHSNKSCKHCIQLILELGHTAKLRPVVSPEGYTHEWEMWLKPVSGDDDKLQNFIQKIEYRLHDSFAVPKIVCKEPPFVISQTGYATFVLRVDIHLRKSPHLIGPTRLKFSYNLVLDALKSIQCVRFEKLNFVNVDPQFKTWLESAGGVQLSNCGGVLSCCAKCCKLHPQTIAPPRPATTTVHINRTRLEDSGFSGSINRSETLQCTPYHANNAARSRFKDSPVVPVKNKVGRPRGRKSKPTKQSSPEAIKSQPIINPISPSPKKSALARRYRPTPEKLSQDFTFFDSPSTQGLQASGCHSTSYFSQRRNQTEKKKVRFAREDNIYFELENSEDDTSEKMNKKGKTKKYLTKKKQVRGISLTRMRGIRGTSPAEWMKNYDDDELSKSGTSSVENVFFDPFSSPKKDVTIPAVTEKRRPGRPKKIQENDSIKYPKNNKPTSALSNSFFHVGPSLGTRNGRKTITFTSDDQINSIIPPSAYNNLYYSPLVCNVSIPNFFVAPNDEDDSGSTDYEDDDDDDDDEVILVEPEHLKETAAHVPQAPQKRKRGRPPKSASSSSTAKPINPVVTKNLKGLQFKSSGSKPPKKIRKITGSKSDDDFVKSITTPFVKSSTATSFVKSSTTAPFPMLPPKEKRKRGRPPKNRNKETTDKLITFQTSVNSTRQTDEVEIQRRTKIDEALYNSGRTFNRNVINNDCRVETVDRPCVTVGTSNVNESLQVGSNLTQEFSTTLLSSTSNILTSTPLKLSNIINIEPIPVPTSLQFEKTSDDIQTDNCSSNVGDDYSDVEVKDEEDWEVCELQRKLNSVKDVEILGKVVEVLKNSGEFNVDGPFYQFDLSTMGQATIDKLKKCFP